MNQSNKGTYALVCTAASVLANETILPWSRTTYSPRVL